MQELQEFNPELMHKPRVLAITKADLLDTELEEALRKELPSNVPAIFISSSVQKGIIELKDLLWKAING